MTTCKHLPNVPNDTSSHSSNKFLSHFSMHCKRVDQSEDFKDTFRVSEARPLTMDRSSLELVMLKRTLRSNCMLLIMVNLSNGLVKPFVALAVGVLGVFSFNPFPLKLSEVAGGDGVDEHAGCHPQALFGAIPSAPMNTSVLDCWVLVTL